MQMIQLFDNQTNRIIVRKSADAREIVGRDPERFSFHDKKTKLRPIVHERAVVGEGEPVTVAATPPASIASAPPRPAKQPSQATIAKRNAALAKARATRAANRAAKAQATV